MLSRLAVRLSIAVICVSASRAHAADVILRSDAWSVAVDPATLAVTATPPAAGPHPIPLSAGQGDLGKVDRLSGGDASAEWTYPDRGISVTARINGDTVTLHFTATRPGSFTWPVLPAKPDATAYLLPCFEGLYVPAGDAEWSRYLADHSPMDTTADLSMPFWGVQRPGHTLTYLLTNPFGNELAFTDDHGRLAISLTHTFRPNWKAKEYEVRISLGPPTPIEPALRYRQYLKDTHQFVPLKEKIERRPEVGKLLGAPCVYLWGGNLLGREDVTDYKGLAAQLVTAAHAAEPSPGKHLWSLMSEEARKAFATLPTAQWVDHYTKGLVTGELTRLLLRGDFYDPDAWKNTPLPTNATSAVRRNRELLAAAFPKCFAPAATWGDGVSAKMIRRLRDAGLDRLRIVVSDGSDLRHHPDAVEAARDAGYLIGPYDSFHSIHRHGEPETWETAQFDDPDLYESGAIIRQDGTPMKGFRQKGHLLSPLAARPAVERRVAAWVKDFPDANLWFVDCDAFGQLYDDFSPSHPATQRQDMEARLSRLKWLGDTHGFVVGSEGGSSYAAGAVDFAEGVETPALGWGDADLQKDKSSPYYLGAYYPPDGPAVFFKPVPLKPSYEKFFFDPRYRLPLYQVALHDSLVTTHHWSFGSFKLKGLVGTREMLELLYGVPPLYHLNPAEFDKRRGEILNHYAFFSPLHRETALLPMTDFAYLTEDRMVQRARFGETVEVVANFLDKAYDHHGHDVPARSLVTIHLTSGETKTYRPPARNDP